ncbi:MAG TPA: Hsp20/alpha crystallin family protein [Blastocatellia bacterium]|nr:Hsp20/alpha crystallin family protein [Blastocatellia bacterium]
MATRRQGKESSKQSNQQQAARQSSQQTSQTIQAGEQSAQSSAEARGRQMQQGVQTGQGGQTGLARQGAAMPSLFSANPFDLMRMSPFALMRRFTEEMDRIFEDFGMGGKLPATQSTGGSWQGAGFFAPQVEVFEREGQLVVRADLPGLTKDDVRVEVTDNGVLLEGERRYEHEENQGGVYRSERSYGSFRRLVPLPEGVNAENAEATFKNGVLEITMQAPQQQTRRRQIEIQGEGGSEAQSQTRQQDKARTTTAGRR